MSTISELIARWNKAADEAEPDWPEDEPWDNREQEEAAAIADTYRQCALELAGRDDLILATVSTSHFSFAAVGETREHVELVLRRAWRKHCAQYDAERGLMRQMIADGEVNYIAIRAGAAFRDGETLIHYTH